MKAKVRAALSRFIPHKYAIDASSLGIVKSLLGQTWFWKNTQTYREACRQLADHLAQAVNLNSKDHLLDLGCGQVQVYCTGYSTIILKALVQLNYKLHVLIKFKNLFLK